MTIRAGQLRHPVIIEQPADVVDDTGSAESKWIELARRFASILPLSGRELLEAQRVQSSATHTITMRRFSGLKTTMRIRHREQYFDINHIGDVQGRNHEVKLLCTESPTGVIGSPPPPYPEESGGSGDGGGD